MLGPLKNNAAAMTGMTMSEADRREARRLEQVKAREEITTLRTWWLDRMRNSTHALREKAVLFWHGHWATSFQKVNSPFLMWQQNETFRSHALGQFEPFAQAMTRDPAMIRYLDLQASKAECPNENFARELMELFTLGEGHYTEDDIRESARAFTGYGVSQKSGGFNFVKRHHDYGTKRFFGKQGEFSGDEIVSIIVSQPRCPEFLSEKVWAFYAGRKPGNELRDKLARHYRSTGLHTGEYLREIFLSREFYSPEIMRRQIKGPVQWLVQSSNIFEVPLPPARLTQNALSQLGQVLFAPPNVKGWDEGRAWITASTLLLRYNISGELVRGETIKPGVDINKIIPPDLTPDEVCKTVGWRLFQSPMPPALAEKTKDFLEKNGDSKNARRDLLHLLLSTPEFQLT
jgi:uncharacterized protein (DUF1800 family)